ncbi:S41 family peptidase [Lapidilactobacillus bayanensis]|uniref:S41 family peptidase n=1 Tax=Lapidilactobacillus bayanensis TaxID=2485998 RepID=UPI000F783DF9|nr:S41 family peptidase [Lapidilactobacillus bayanensis]
MADKQNTSHQDENVQPSEPSVSSATTTPTEDVAATILNDTENESNKTTHKKKRRQPPVKRFRRLTYWFSVVVALAVGMIAGVLIVMHQMQPTLRINSELNEVIGVYQTVKNNYYQKVSQKKLVNGAVKGMLDSLGDPFSQYLDVDQSSSLNDSTSGSFEGIGAEVQKAEHAIKIISPIKGSPAAKAGLKANDLIMKINGKSTAELSVDQAVSKIRGAKGTQVTLEIKRDTSTFTIKVKRAKVDQATVTGRILPSDKTVGQIQISTFAENTASGMKKMIKELRQKGATRFIIDVRGNPGGLMNSALATSSMFLKNGQVIMRVKARTGKEEVYKAGKTYDDGFKVTEPVVVLADSGSASASEIFSAALQQSAGVKLVGTKTYGKGTVQTVVPLNNSSEMKFTTAKWLTPNDTWINKKGITPDVKADYPALAKLSLLSSGNTLQAGNVGRQVKLLQTNLKDLGYAVKVTSIYDDQTVAAVKQLQAKAKLSQQDGIFDDQVRTALYAEVTSYLQAHDNILNAGLKALTQSVTE